MKDNPFIELLVTLLLLITVIVGGALYQKHKQQLENNPPVPVAKTELKLGKVEDIPKQDVGKCVLKKAGDVCKMSFEESVKTTRE